MLGKLVGIICIVAVICGIVTGNIPQLAVSVINGAERAVKTVLSLVGIMCLWCGIMNVMKEAGAVRFLSRLISPLIKLCFPSAYASGKGKQEIAANISANLLGIGNAATPIAINAMKEMQADNEDGHGKTATDDMVTFAVLNTASVSLLPTTVIFLRAASGSVSPYRVIIPIWICSFTGAILSVTLTRLLNMFDKRVRKGGGRK